MSRGFGSDNHAGVLPEALAAIAAANEGHAPSYGHDALTAARRAALPRRARRPGAGVPRLQRQRRQRAGAAGAAAAVGGRDLRGDRPPQRRRGRRARGVGDQAADRPDARRQAHARAGLATRVVRIGDEHAVQPRVVSISQSTELGTRLRASTRSARWPTTPTTTGCCCTSTARGSPTRPRRSASRCARRPPTSASTLLSFGGTKAGLLAGEAVVVLVRRGRRGAALPAQADAAARVEDALHRRAVRRAARGRALALRRGPRQRDGRAARRRRCAASTGVEVTQEPQANAVFAILPPGVADRLRERWFFYDWDELRRRGALDVLVGHDRGRRRRVRGRRRGRGRRGLAAQRGAQGGHERPRPPRARAPCCAGRG